MSRFNVLKDECLADSSNQNKNKTHTNESNNSLKNKKKKIKKSKQTNPQNEENDWIQKDQEICDFTYQKDIEEAILQSKLELERPKSQPEDSSQANSRGDSESLSKASKSKNRNKNRTRDGQQKTVSLNEFQNMALSNNTTEKSYSTQEAKGPPVVDTLFDDVHLAAKRLVDKEKDKEEYERRYKVEAVIRGQYIVQLENKQNKIDEQSNEIEGLKSKLQDAQSEVELIRYEKSKLEKLLQKGKMSEVTNLLQQIEDFSQMRDDLTNQITELTAEFEKERSVSHSLRIELDRLKTAKLSK